MCTLFAFRPMAFLRELVLLLMLWSSMHAREFQTLSENLPEGIYIHLQEQFYIKVPLCTCVHTVWYKIYAFQMYFATFFLSVLFRSRGHKPNCIVSKQYYKAQKIYILYKIY